MKLLFAITLLLVLSQAQAHEHGSDSGGGSACDAASEMCAPEMDAIMGCA